MDKKFMGIIAVMLAVCLFIISGAGTVPKTEEPVSTASNSSGAADVDRFFDKNKVIEINLTLSEADFQDMLQNPSKEEYKQASVTVNGEKADYVGFRVKGNSSLSSVARSASKRFSFKLDMDHYIEGQNLAGLTKLNLNNSFSDPSYMREYLSYSLLKEMGIPTPAFSYANVYINGNLAGLYLAVEGLEESFLKRHYGNDYGTLYKPYGEHGKGTDLVYSDNNIESYSGLKAVTKAKNGSSEALINMIKALNEGRELEKYLNVDEILRYFAVNTVLVNMDSYQGQFTHNYYLYEENGVFAFLPWDYNLSFGGFGMGGSQNSSSLNIDQPVSGTTLAARPLLGKLLEVKEYKDLYHQYIEEFINGPFALEKMQAEIERVASMIRPHLLNDPTKFYTMEQFEQAISEPIVQGNSEIPSVFEGEQKPLTAEQGQVQPVQKGPAMRGQQGGGMMQGNTSIGLIKFVRDRIENATKQLDGEVQAVDNTQMPPEGKQRQGDLRERNPNMGGPPDINGRPGNMANGGMENMFGGRILSQNILTQQMYLLGGSLLLLLAALLMVFKRKTKYSI